MYNAYTNYMTFLKTRNQQFRNTSNPGGIAEETWDVK